MALMALTMRSAWYLANLVLEVISGSLFFHTDMTSRKVDAARRVSAVCLQMVLEVRVGNGTTCLVRTH